MRHARTRRVNPSVLLDTHVWLWWLLGQPEHSGAERAALDALAAAGTPPGSSAISLWEAQMLTDMGRLQLDSLPKGFHGDPADRIIVATARARGLPLTTRDCNIRRSRSVKRWKP